MGREFPEVKKERIRQQKGEKVKLSKSKLYQAETKTPIQEYDSQRKASREKALSLYWSYSQEKSKCHEKGGKRRIVSSTVIFERPPNNEAFTWYMSSFQGMTGNVLFASQSPLKLCEWLSVCIQQIQKHQLNRQWSAQKLAPSRWIKTQSN